MTPLFGSVIDSGMFAAGDFVAAALGFDIDHRESDHRFVMGTRDVDLRDRVIAAGTVAIARDGGRPPVQPGRGLPGVDHVLQRPLAQPGGDECRDSFIERGRTFHRI